MLLSKRLNFIAPALPKKDFFSSPPLPTATKEEKGGGGRFQFSRREGCQVLKKAETAKLTVNGSSSLNNNFQIVGL